MRSGFSLRERVKKLRATGKTYSEIKSTLGVDIPKSTLNSWCRNIALPQSYQRKLELFLKKNITKARQKALIVNKKKRAEYLVSLKNSNQPIAKKIKDKSVAKIALAMLCLGEASKYSGGSRAFTLGSADIRIILIFLKLLEYCFDDFDINKIRCTVQCRADQDTEQLKQYWMQVTNIPERLFYRTRIDPRTIGKATKKKDYKGVLRIDYLHTRTQLDLETLANLVFNKLGPVVYR